MNARIGTATNAKAAARRSADINQNVARSTFIGHGLIVLVHLPGEVVRRISLAIPFCNVERLVGVFRGRPCENPAVLGHPDQASSSIAICAILCAPPLKCEAIRWPTDTAPMQRTTDAATFMAARVMPPDRMRSSVCKLNDEKVV